MRKRNFTDPIASFYVSVSLLSPGIALVQSFPDNKNVYLDHVFGCYFPLKKQFISSFSMMLVWAVLVVFPGSSESWSLAGLIKSWLVKVLQLVSNCSHIFSTCHVYCLVYTHTCNTITSRGLCIRTKHTQSSLLHPHIVTRAPICSCS